MNSVERLAGLDKALIIHAKWIDMILDGKKVWEMRSRTTHFRGRFGLVPAGTGQIVGEATLVDCWRLEEHELERSVDKHCVDPAEQLQEKGYRYAWVLQGAQRYDRPFQYRHPRGAVIWVTLSESILT